MDPNDPSDPPADSDAVEAAEKMNDPQGPQPGVVENPPEPDDSDPLPEMMQ